MTRRNYSKWRPVGNSTQTGFWISVYNEMHTTWVYEGIFKMAAGGLNELHVIYLV